MVKIFAHSCSSAKNFGQVSHFGCTRHLMEQLVWSDDLEFAVVVAGPAEILVFDPVEAFVDLLVLLFLSVYKYKPWKIEFTIRYFKQARYRW